MKKLSISIFLMFLCFRVSAQCPPAGDIILTSQAEVNNFQTLYGSCPNLVVNGDLVINGADISSLLPLAGLKGVTGDLFIEDAEELTTLGGLESLETVGDRLFVWGNDKLTSIAALSKLTHTPGDVTIGRNLLLTSLQGLHNITSVGEDLKIEENSKLIDLDALVKLKTVGGNLTIISNDKLTDIDGLSALTTVSEHIEINYNNELVTPVIFQELTGAVSSISIRGNAKMKSLPGFPKLSEVYGHIQIMECPELTSMAGLAAVKTLNRLIIVENASLTNLNGLGDLEEVIADLLVTDNPSLTDISGLSALISVGGEMEISRNHALETPGTLPKFTGGGEISISDNSKLKYLPVFPKLVDFSGEIRIVECPQLISLEGLSNLETVGEDLAVVENSLLPNLSGLGKLARVGGELLINDNASLTDISVLTALVSVGGYFEVSDNPELVTPGTLPEFAGDGDDIYFENNAKMKILPNFPKLVSFSGYITIIECPELVSLSGLSALRNFTGNLRILDNTSLGTCAIAGICSLLSVAPDQAWIANNATGCNNVEEVQEACETVLPVTLVNFSGEMNEGFATLAWSTSSEINSDYFIIEHRNTGNEKWSALGKIPAKRESSSLATYDFIHNQPTSGENLYRLKMVDADQTFAYSRIISIRNEEFTDVFAYPNPVTSKLHFSGSGGVKQISVYDAAGGLRLQKDLTVRNEVDLKNLLPGKYLIKVQTSDGNSHTRNVIKE